MGNHNKKAKKDQKEKKGKTKPRSRDLSLVLWPLLAVAVALVALVIQQNVFFKKIPDSYETSAPETVQYSANLDPAVKKAINVYMEPESHPNKGIRQLPKDLGDWPPGERGVGVKINEAKMPNQELEKKKAMWEKHAFEEYISEMISPDRSLPDWRGDWCRNTYDPNRQDLNPTSVVICFHNEAWSTLIRTVHSILNRSPPHLLEEILLIDDLSTMEHLKDRLDEYMKKFPKVRVIRKEERMGLIKCRMFGSTVAKANVLTYLDSHIEAGIGWLEPLLYRVKDEPKMIVSPVIDAINDTTFYYTFIEKDLKGLLNWNMRFEWQELSPEERNRKTNIWAPHINPVMSGGLFTINREWFQYLGYYDTGMEIWGGENFEVSFKAWMCGGRIEIAPCSRVGHVFRTWSPYKVDTKKNVAYNNIRVAQVWMDDFKFLYFDRLGHYEMPLENRLGYYGEVSERQDLREKLGCKSFKWYLDKVISGALPYHPLIGAGEIRNDHMGFCLDQNDQIEFMNNPVYTIPCHGDAGNQYWWMNSNKYLMRDYLCVGVLPDGLTVSVMDCARVKTWLYKPEKKRLLYNGKCLTVGEANHIYTAHVMPCEDGNPRQDWVFSRYNPRGIVYPDLSDETKVVRAMSN